MKGLTYEDWLKNPIPRDMWVWNNNIQKKQIEKVVYISKDGRALSVYKGVGAREESTCWYEHCAGIEEPTKRPCTREELIEMLKKQGLPMLKHNLSGINYMVEAIADNYCFIFDSHNYVYQALCEKYTLLDGTELWVNDVPPECISPTPDEIGG